MGRKVAKVSDPLSMVVLFDTELFEMPDQSICESIVGKLKEQFSADGKLKTASTKLKMKQSIQWLYPKLSSSHERIPNEWTKSNFIIVIKPFSEFVEQLTLMLQRGQNLDGLLESILETSPIGVHSIKLIFFDDHASAKKKKNSWDSTNLNKPQIEKAFDWSLRCHIDLYVEVCLEPMSSDEIAAEVTRATKSIIDLNDQTKQEQVFGTGKDIWIPNKIGTPIQVSSENVGLLPLWQLYLRHVSKAVGPDLAKTISLSDGFRSPCESFETLKGHVGDGEKVLMNSVAVRPTAAANGAIAFRGSRPNVGIETSRKFYKLFTSLNGEEIL